MCASSVDFLFFVHPFIYLSFFSFSFLLLSIHSFIIFPPIYPPSTNSSSLHSGIIHLSTHHPPILHLPIILPSSIYQSSIHLSPIQPLFIHLPTLHQSIYILSFIYPSSINPSPHPPSIHLPIFHLPITLPSIPLSSIPPISPLPQACLWYPHCPRKRDVNCHSSFLSLTESPSSLLVSTLCLLWSPGFYP